MPFVTSNISKQDGPEGWRWREAATFAFGSVVEGPSPSSLVTLVQQALPFLLQVGPWRPPRRLDAALPRPQCASPMLPPCFAPCTRSWLEAALPLASCAP